MTLRTAPGDSGPPATISSGNIRAVPGCPAWHGGGADIRTAKFALVVDDCELGPDRRPTCTEVFGLFYASGQERGDDAVLTAGLTVPIASPIARLAHRVSADPTGAWPREVGDELRHNVARCPCTAVTECPALDELRLVEALERAVGGR